MKGETKRTDTELSVKLNISTQQAMCIVKSETRGNQKSRPNGKSKRMSRNSKVCQHGFVFYITRLLLPHTTEYKTMFVGSSELC